MNSTLNPGSTTRGDVFSAVTRLRDWMDARGKPAWIIAIVLGFVAFWPIGLGLLGYLIWSKRMFTCNRDTYGSSRRAAASSGNSAFDAYRAETLKRLEDEQREFQDFLRHLREAKDKAEFDDFMRGRENRNSASVTNP